MQVQSGWKVAANLELLYGFAHPPVQLHTNNNDGDQVTLTNTPSTAEKGNLMESNKLQTYDKNNNDVEVDARNTCNIDDTFYGSIQDVMSSIKVRRQLIRYYYFMLSKIDLRDDVDEFGMESNQKLNKSEEIQCQQKDEENETTSKNEDSSQEKHRENTIKCSEEGEQEEREGFDENVATAKVYVKSETDLSPTADTLLDVKMYKHCKEEQYDEEEQSHLEHNTMEHSSSRECDRNGSDNCNKINENDVKCDTEMHKGNAKRPSYSFRARGILTEIHDPSLLSSEALLPWEFYVINTNSTNWEYEYVNDNNDGDGHYEDDSDDNINDDLLNHNDRHIVNKRRTIRYREQYEDEINNSQRVEEYTNAFHALIKEKISLPAFVRAIAQQSNLQETPEEKIKSANASNGKSNQNVEIGMSNPMHANQQSLYGNDKNENAFASSDSVRKTKNRLSLYTRLAESFTGVYPGMAIGVIGEPFQWSATGVLTGVLVHKFVLSSRPCFPWSRSESLTMMPYRYKQEQEEHISSNEMRSTEDEVSKRLVYTPEGEHKQRQECSPIADGSETKNAFTNMTRSAPMRIHFCSGPFPRRDTHALLRLVITQALTREADLLIIGGPLIKPFESFDKELLPLINGTFNDLLDGYVDVIEETLQQWRQEHELSHYNYNYNYSKHNVERSEMVNYSHRLKVILIPHRDDVTQMPVLPQTLYALSDTEDIYMRSNPCRISFRGVHIGVCNEDVVGVMQEQMVERWPHTEGNLRRVVETLVQSRVYTPIMQLPLKTMDVRYLHKLRIDYEPRRCSVRVEDSNKVNLSEMNYRQRKQNGWCRREDNWNLLKSYLLHNNAKTMWKHALLPNKHDAVTMKRAKTERNDNDDEDIDIDIDNDRSIVSENKIRPNQRNVNKNKNDATSSNSKRINSVEFIPHIIFLPSTRPQFAYVTHRGVANTNSQHNKHTASLKKIVDEANVDNVDNATGVLVINQEVWSRRTSAQFALRVAEVTINDSRRVALCGARASTGVSCGLLHIFNASV